MRCDPSQVLFQGPRPGPVVVALKDAVGEVPEAFPFIGCRYTSQSRIAGLVCEGAVAMLHVLWMFIVGIVVGAIARFIMPGSQHLGLLMTGVLGIAGSLVGGLLARVFSKPKEGAPVHPAGLVLSVIGALILLYVWNHVAR